MCRVHAPINSKSQAYVGEVIAACAQFLPYVTDGKNGGLGFVNPEGM